MLGGTFWIALLRNSMGAGLMMAVYLLLDTPKYTMKKTIGCYIGFWFLSSVVFSVWFWIDVASFVRFAGIASVPVIGIFCIFMSGAFDYLSIYKLALCFYMLTVTVFCGIDAARLWFHGNLWADILVRGCVIGGIVCFIAKKIRLSFLEGTNFLHETMDLFSSVTLVTSLMVVAIITFWPVPDPNVFSIPNTIRKALMLFMAGIIQYMAFHLYLHLGIEQRYEAEKELLKMNEQLLRHQLELVKESAKETARIRHDARHHRLLIEEYIKNGETDQLLSYVKQYEEDISSGADGLICNNEAIQNILSIYARRSAKENIEVSLNVNVTQDIAIRDIDLVAILANLFENAIHGCIASKVPQPIIQVSVVQKKSKLVIQCKNTCSNNIKFHKGLPKSSTGEGIGISSIIKTVAYYSGETDFVLDGNMFVARVLLNLSILPPPSRKRPFLDKTDIFTEVTQNEK